MTQDFSMELLSSLVDELLSHPHFMSGRPFERFALGKTICITHFANGFVKLANILARDNNASDAYQWLYAFSGGLSLSNIIGEAKMHGVFSLTVWNDSPPLTASESSGSAASSCRHVGLDAVGHWGEALFAAYVFVPARFLGRSRRKVGPDGRGSFSNFERAHSPGGGHSRSARLRVTCNSSFAGRLAGAAAISSHTAMPESGPCPNSGHRSESPTGLSERCTPQGLRPYGASRDAPFRRVFTL